jgi:uncharacterized membrane protein
MSITSIGSSFAYVKPEAAVRSTAASAEASEASEAAEATPDRDDARAAAPAPSAAPPAKAPPSQGEDRAALARLQETAREAPTPRAASRAYSPA